MNIFPRDDQTVVARGEDGCRLTSRQRSVTVGQVQDRYDPQRVTTFAEPELTSVSPNYGANQLGMSNKEMKSVSGQKRDVTLALYIESADQRALATKAIRRLSAWASEAGCLTSSKELDIENAEDG